VGEAPTIRDSLSRRGPGGVRSVPQIEERARDSVPSERKKAAGEMENKKLKLFREKLVQKKNEILEVYEKNKTYGKEADEEGAQDIADKASNSYTKEFLFSLSNNERDLLQLVDEALVRIDDRRFGVCVVCEDEMDRKRLEAVPWAKRCISCQEKQEQGLL
jgi:DnaK suppressor protein